VAAAIATGALARGRGGTARGTGAQFLAAGAVPLFVGAGFTPEMLADHFLEGR